MWRQSKKLPDLLEETRDAIHGVNTAAVRKHREDVITPFVHGGGNVLEHLVAALCRLAKRAEQPANLPLVRRYPRPVASPPTLLATDRAHYV